MSGWNLRLTTYGDQAFFIRRTLFHAVGGFRDLPICEDIDFQNRMRQEGRWIKLTTRVTTSSRRFLHNGPIRQQLLNIAIVACFLAGVHPKRLHRWYRLRKKTHARKSQTDSVAPAEKAPRECLGNRASRRHDGFRA